MKPSPTGKFSGVAESTPVKIKKKRNFGILALVLTVFLLLFLVTSFFILRLFSSKNIEQPSSVSIPPANKTVEKLNPVSPIIPEKQKNESIKETVKKSFSYHQNQINLPQLNGIMYSTMFPQAIINGQLVKEGDFIENFKVDKISPDKVTVSADDNSYDIKM